MRHYFNSLQIFTAVALGLVMFVVILWVEHTNYRQQAQIINPFEQAQNIQTRVVVPGNSVEAWLHKTGEVFVVFSNTKFNLINQARELEEGVVFLNSQFQSQDQIDEAQKGFKAPFNLDEVRLHGGQIKIGPAVLSAPQGIAVVKRDLVRQETEVYAYGHAVDLYLPGASRPFLIPAGYSILLKENRATLLGSLYFTKLKKELNLRPLQPNSLGAEVLQSAFLQGIEESNAWEKAINLYAENSVFSWAQSAPSSVFGKFFANLQHIRRYYALGVNKSYKLSYRYHLLQQDLQDAYFLTNNGQLEASAMAAQKFVSLFKSADWIQFFIETPSFKLRWDDFSRSQKIWFYSVPPESDEASLLKILWGPSALKTAQNLEDQYYLFERYYIKNYQVKALEQLKFLTENLAQLPVNQDTAKITRVRRKIAFLLQINTDLQNKEAFEFYAQLINIENLALDAQSESAQETRLEIAQELLLFLKDAIDITEAQSGAIALLRAYRDLNVAALSESLGRSVFSAQERDTLNRIQGLGVLSEDKLEDIRSSKLAAAEALTIYDDLKNLNETPVNTGPIGIQTESALLELLQSTGALTQGMSVRSETIEEATLLVFNQASLNGYSLQGKFNTNRQRFDFLKLGKITEDRGATSSNLAAFLNSMVAANKEQSTSAQPTVSQADVNYTPAGKLQRRNILTILGNQGIVVKLDDVLLTDESLQTAAVSQASFEKQYLLDFDFSIKNPIRIRNVKAQFGRNTILLPGQVFGIQDLETKLKEAIESKFIEATQNQPIDSRIKPNKNWEI